MNPNPEESAIMDEARVPTYVLPDPLEGVAGRDDWSRRRGKWLGWFAGQMYGRTPVKNVAVRMELRTVEPRALGGLATRKEFRIHLGEPGKGCFMDLLLYVPNIPRGPHPVFLGLNFAGNHSIDPDPGIALGESWIAARYPGVVDSRATDSSRGSEAKKWPLARILARGYAVATVHYGDLDPDFDDGFRNGIHPLFYGPGQTRPAEDEWGSIGAWAWGLSRALDGLALDPDVDPGRVAVHGHSRLGKAALWAGAQDERFALVVSNNSGCGGAALSRRCFGETVEKINTVFPHWFCRNFHGYNRRESFLPFDQHILLALVAPRPVYVASAQDDLWADPQGEFLSALHASPVYELLVGGGLGVRDMPPVGRPVPSRIGYHIRQGGHDVTDFDWECWMDHADRWMK